MSLWGCVQDLLENVDFDRKVEEVINDLTGDAGLFGQLGLVNLSMGELSNVVPPTPHSTSWMTTARQKLDPNFSTL